MLAIITLLVNTLVIVMVTLYRSYIACGVECNYVIVRSTPLGSTLGRLSLYNYCIPCCLCSIPCFPSLHVGLLCSADAVHVCGSCFGAGYSMFSRDSLSVDHQAPPGTTMTPVYGMPLDTRDR